MSNRGVAFDTLPDGRPSVVTAARVRRARPRFRLALVVLPVALVIALVFAVREVSRSEATLRLAGRKATRVLVYELRPQGALSVPIEPGTDLLRIAVQAAGTGVRANGKRRAILSVALAGSLGRRTERLVLDLPDAGKRATPEDPGYWADDPLGVNVDVSAIGRGEAVLSVEELDGAEATWVRFYRREAMDSTEALRRRKVLEAGRLEHLARREGELDWVDLDDVERDALLASRWKKVGATSLRSTTAVMHALALAPRLSLPLQPFTTVESLEVDDEALGVLTVTAPVRMRVHSDVGGARLTLTVHSRTGEPRTVEAIGAEDISLGAGDTTMTIASKPRSRVSVSASDRTVVHAGQRVRAYRTTPDRPARVEATEAPLVVRIVARRPFASGVEPSAATFSLEATTGTQRSAATATVRRSRVDRYVGASDLVPGEATHFYVVVPRGETVALAPTEGTLDLSLYELDEEATAIAARAAARGDERGEPGSPRGGVFVSRKPSNAGELGAIGALPSAVVTLAIAPSSVSAKAAPPRHARVPPLERPRADTAHFGGFLFQAHELPLSVRLPGGEPMLLPLRFEPARPVDVLVDHGLPIRVSRVLFSYLTDASLALSPDDDGRAHVLLGDDLAPGMHTLTFEATPGSHLWVHAPWARTKGGARQNGPHWVGGGFE